MSVRLALHADIARLAEIERASEGREQCADALACELTRSWARLFVLERGGVLAGFINVWMVADEVEVLFIATALGWRRRGVATELLRHALAAARDEGATRAVLEVRRGNHGAIALYELLSFERVGERRGYYDDGEDALLMALAL